LGWHDVDQLLDSMSSRSIAEWMIYDSIEPFGSPFLDAHFAQLAATNINKDRPRSKQVPEKRFRLIQTVRQNTARWDPQAYFNDLKARFKWLTRSK
jgi:hypothetical protein